MQSRGNQIGALLHGVPHPRFKYSSSKLTKSFQREAGAADSIVVSWESFENLVWNIHRPVTLIVHNVMSDVLTQLYGRVPVLKLAAKHSLEWERRTYALKNLTLVALSKRDRALINARAPDANVLVAPPGTPPLAQLQREQLFREVVVSGSYDWAPKRRDLIELSNQIAVNSASNVDIHWRHDLPLPQDARIDALNNVSRSIIKSDYELGLRFGLIPDTFLGGFKLKSTYYISNNCILLSRCDIRDEFSGLPYSEEFVHFTPNVSDIEHVISAVSKRDSQELYGRWRVFQDACAKEFSWRKSSNVISSTVGPFSYLSREV
ncbi:hypothetical protein ACFSLT_04400 [Novosphingobium resinovorum]